MRSPIIRSHRSRFERMRLTRIYKRLLTLSERLLPSPIYPILKI
jgi:hypothetical protein